MFNMKNLRSVIKDVLDPNYKTKPDKLYIDQLEDIIIEYDKIKCEDCARKKRSQYGLLCTKWNSLIPSSDPKNFGCFGFDDADNCSLEHQDVKLNYIRGEELPYFLTDRFNIEE